MLLKLDQPLLTVRGEVRFDIALGVGLQSHLIDLVHQERVFDDQHLFVHGQAVSP